MNELFLVIAITVLAVISPVRTLPWSLATAMPTDGAAGY